MAEVQIPGSGGLRGETKDGRMVFAGCIKWPTAFGLVQQAYVLYHDGGWHICDEPIDAVDTDGSYYQALYDHYGGQGNYLHARRDKINRIIREELGTPADLDSLTQQTTPYSWRALNQTIKRYFKFRRWPWQEVPEMVPVFWES